MSSFLLLAFLLPAAALNLPLPPTIITNGAATTSQGAFGFAAPNTGVAASTAATGGLVNSATIVTSGGVGSSGTSAPTPQFQLPSLERYVPDYRDTSAAQTSATSSTKRKVKVRKYATPAPQAHPEVCWTISKQCCYKPVQKGYKCRDYYMYKYARCHPVLEYQQICGEIVEHPKDHPKPEGRVLYEESIIKNYDSRYGPHVEGYPAEGESDFYDSAVIPQRPHGVTAEPVAPPVPYPSGAGNPQEKSQQQTSGSSDQWKQEGTGGSQTYQANEDGSYPENGESRIGENYSAPPAPAAASTQEPNPAPTPPTSATQTEQAQTYTSGESHTSSAEGGGYSTPEPGTGPEGKGERPVAAVENPVQSGGTYRFVEPSAELPR